MGHAVLIHPMVIGEIALGSVAKRAQALRHLQRLPMAVTASDSETLTFIARHKLASTGVGYVDAALLAAAALTPPAVFWTRDKVVRAAAQRCGLAAPFA